MSVANLVSVLSVPNSLIPDALPLAPVLLASSPFPSMRCALRLYFINFCEPESICPTFPLLTFFVFFFTTIRCYARFRFHRWDASAPNHWAHCAPNH